MQKTWTVCRTFHISSSRWTWHSWLCWDVWLSPFLCTTKLSYFLSSLRHAGFTMMVSEVCVCADSVICNAWFCLVTWILFVLVWFVISRYITNTFHRQHCSLLGLQCGHFSCCLGAFSSLVWKEEEKQLLCWLKRRHPLDACQMWAALCKGKS